MISLLTKYFNLILVSSIIPSDWSLSIIIAIYKNKGDINDPDNYRGITLLRCIGKFFTMVLNNRLSIFLEKNNLLGEEQYLTTLEPKHAIPMCKFRANNHQLPIVTGRYKNVDRSE